MPTRVTLTAAVIVCLFAGVARAQGPVISIKSIREIQESSVKSAVLSPAEIKPVPAIAQPPLPATSPPPSAVSQPPLAIVQAQLSVMAQPLPPNPALAPTEVLPMPSVAMPVNPQVRGLDDDRPIAAIRTAILPAPGMLPQNMAAQRFVGETPAMTCRPWESLLYNWDAPDLCYSALRYEEVNLERLGYTYHPVLQPGISMVHFIGATAALPYSLALHPPHECIYPLGHYRPGSPAPYQWHWPETSLKAHAFQAGTVAGLIFLIP